MWLWILCLGLVGGVIASGFVYAALVIASRVHREIETEKDIYELFNHQS